MDESGTGFNARIKQGQKAAHTVKKERGRNKKNKRKYKDYKCRYLQGRAEDEDEEEKDLQRTVESM